jgi:hypothetical protein
MVKEQWGGDIGTPRTSPEDWEVLESMEDDALVQVARGCDWSSCGYVMTHGEAVMMTVREAKNIFTR